MTTPIRKIGIIGTGQMGNGIAHVIALTGYEVILNDLSKEKVDKALEIIDRNLTRQVASGKITEQEKIQAMSRISYAENVPRVRRCRPRHRGGNRGRDGEAQDLRLALSVPQAGRHRRYQHLVDLHHQARGGNRSPGAFHRPAFHEPGPGHGAGRDDQGHRHRRRHLRQSQGLRRDPRQNHGGVGGFPGLHGQPRAAADDQRGGLHALRGRGFGRCHRHRDAARRPPSHGPVAACRLHRARYLPLDHAGAV